MAQNVVNQGGPPVAEASRSVRLWVTGLALSSLVMLVAGVTLAGPYDGVARPWTGLPFVMAMGMALVVGASKTSSA